MSTQSERIDEVATHYKDPKRVVKFIWWVFWIGVVISILIPRMQDDYQVVAKGLYITIVVMHAIASILLSVYLIPRAEKYRRKQLLSNAFDAPLTHEKTHLYYNNEFPPSISRLGANVMENAFFSKSTAAEMLPFTRCVVGIYMFVWLLVFSLHQTDVDSMIWLTQIVFSSAILVRWVQLESLHSRLEIIYEALHAHFLSGHEDNPKALATILDSFATYECTKATAGILLSEKVFKQLNDILSIRWAAIRQDLKMNEN